MNRRRHGFPPGLVVACASWLRRLGEMSEGCDSCWPSSQTSCGSAIKCDEIGGDLLLDHF